MSDRDEQVKRLADDIRAENATKYAPADAIADPSRATDRIGARYLALCLGLRIETLHQRNGQTVYALWPDDGFAWELYDPPTSTTWRGVYDMLNLIASSARH